LVGRRAIIMIGATHVGYANPPRVTQALESLTACKQNLLTAFIALFKFFYNGCCGWASYIICDRGCEHEIEGFIRSEAPMLLGISLHGSSAFCSPYFINPLSWLGKFKAPTFILVSLSLLTTPLSGGAKYGYVWAGSNFAVSYSSTFHS